MHLEQAHLIHPWNRLYEFFWKLHYFKDERFVEFGCRLTSNYCIFQKKVRRAYSTALDAPVQGASFCVEKIKLASKLRVLLEMALESAIFKQKVPAHIFRHQPIKFHYLQV